MTDRLCRGLVPSRGLRAVFVRLGDTARMAIITCEFCRSRYVVSEPELEDIRRRLVERDRAGG